MVNGKIARNAILALTEKHDIVVFSTKKKAIQFVWRAVVSLAPTMPSTNQNSVNAARHNSNSIFLHSISY